MSKELISIGSETKPPTLFPGEYHQWRIRIIQFLDNIDEGLMQSILKGPLDVYVNIPAVAATRETPEIPATRIKKTPSMYTPDEKEQAKIDKRALTLLTMAIPNEIFNRVDSLTSAKALWDEVEAQMQGSAKAQALRLDIAIGVYESFKEKKGETFTESYNRFNNILNDLRRNRVQKLNLEINNKFLIFFGIEWECFTDNMITRNLSKKSIHDIFDSHE